jgi:hypothetical protein
MRKEIVFLIAGFLAGLIAAAFGTSRPTMLAVGVGPLFFAATLAAIAMTNSWSHLQGGIWRYAMAALLSTVAYVLALFTFSVAMGYAPQFAGLRASGDIVEFRGDVWLGLAAAVLVAAICVELVAFTLTGKWSNLSLALLVLAGLASVLVTFIANLQAHHYWSFIGVLLPVGEALSCGVVGAQIWRPSEQLVRT